MDDDCDDDYLIIRDGDETGTNFTDSNGENWCYDYTPPKPFLSSSNQLTLQFISDGNDNYGFLLEWEAVDEGEGECTDFFLEGLDTRGDCSYPCGANLTGTSGWFASENFPSRYNNNQDCYYLITVPEGYNIFMTFLTFQVSFRKLYFAKQYFTSGLHFRRKAVAMNSLFMMEQMIQCQKFSTMVGRTNRKTLHHQLINCFFILKLIAVKSKLVF